MPVTSGPELTPNLEPAPANSDSSLEGGREVLSGGLQQLFVWSCFQGVVVDGGLKAGPHTCLVTHPGVSVTLTQSLSGLDLVVGICSLFSRETCDMLQAGLVETVSVLSWGCCEKLWCVLGSLSLVSIEMPAFVSTARDGGRNRLLGTILSQSQIQS